jgi:hypothetical protein
MQAAEFICVWFVEQHHLMLVDRRSLPSTAELDAEGPGWRIVACNNSANAGSTQSAAGTTQLCVWPPLSPHDLPLLIGPGDGLTAIEIFDLSPSVNARTNPDHSIAFDLDPALTIPRADGWWVLPCRDPEDPLESAVFGEAACIGRHVFAADPVPALIEEIIVQLTAVTPKTVPAGGYLIIPVTGTRVGPAVFAQYKPSEPEVTVDIALRPGSADTLQPVIEMKTANGTPLNDVTQSFHYCVFRRNAGYFDLPDFGYSRPNPSRDSRLHDQFDYPLPEPVLHGDVVGIVCRGVPLTLSPRLGAGIARAIESAGPLQIALLVRREDGFTPAAEDPALVLSGRLQDLREKIVATTADMTVDCLLRSLKARLTRHLMRTAVATSYLIDDRLAARARAELTDLLLGDRVVHLEHITYAACSPARLERLVGARRPLDEPLRQSVHRIEGPALTACIAEVAEFDGAARGNEDPRLLALLSHRVAIRAVLDVATRAPAMACWKAATAG